MMALTHACTHKRTHANTPAGDGTAQQPRRQRAAAAACAAAPQPASACVCVCVRVCRRWCSCDSAGSSGRGRQASRQHQRAVGAPTLQARLPEGNTPSTHLAQSGLLCRLHFWQLLLRERHQLLAQLLAQRKDTKEGPAQRVCVCVCVRVCVCACVRVCVVQRLGCGVCRAKRKPRAVRTTRNEP
jgi:hypothetical protein